MALVSIFIPLLIFLVLSLFGRFLGYKGALHLSVNFMFLAVFCSFYMFYIVSVQNKFIYCTLGVWISCGLLVIP
jgi:hypothetical protein